MKKKLLTTLLTIALCLSLSVGATFALFTDEAKVNVAVTSGTVDVEANVNTLAYKTLTKDWTAFDDGSTTTNFDNLGGSATVQDGTVTLSKVAPGDGVSFNIDVVNKSDIKVKYRTTITNANNSDEALFKALQVSVDGNKFFGKTSSAWALLDESTNGSVVKTISVKVELPAEAEGAELMGKTCEFVVSVDAIQANAETFDEVITTEEVNVNADSTVSEDAVVETASASAYIPAGTEFVAGQNTATLQVSKAEANTGNFAFGDGAEQVGINVDIPEVADTNTGVIVVTLKGYIKDKPATISLFHKGVPMNPVAKGTAHKDYNADDYYYDSTTGDITFATDDFSNFTAVLDSMTITTEQELYNVAFAANDNANRKYLNVHTVILANDIELTKQFNVKNDITVLLNGNKLINTTNSSSEIFIVRAPLTLVGGEIEVNKSALFNAYADVKLDDVKVSTTTEGAFGTSLFKTNANCKELAIINSEIIVNNIKINGNGLFSNWASTKILIKDTVANIVLDPTYGQYLVYRSAANVTIEGCEFLVVDTDGFYYEVAEIENEGVDNRVGYVKAGYAVSNADELVEALEKASTGELKLVVLTNDVKIDPATMSNAYGKTGINVKNGQIIDGKGHTLDIKGAGGTWDSGINTTGGIIRNIKITGSFRGIFINHNSDYSEKVVLDNVVIEGTVYTISCDQGLYQGLEATNCTFNGWTSFAETLGNAKFVNCSFGEGNGYAYCRPYAQTEFVGCEFEAGFSLDPAAIVTFEGCTLDGAALTEENLTELIAPYIGVAKNATVKA